MQQKQKQTRETMSNKTLKSYFKKRIQTKKVHTSVAIWLGDKLPQTPQLADTNVHYIYRMFKQQDLQAHFQNEKTDNPKL